MDDRDICRQFARIGGLAAASKMSPEQRTKRARNAVKVRWNKVYWKRIEDEIKAQEALRSNTLTPASDNRTYRVDKAVSDSTASPPASASQSTADDLGAHGTGDPPDSSDVK